MVFTSFTLASDLEPGKHHLHIQDSERKDSNDRSLTDTKENKFMKHINPRDLEDRTLTHVNAG